MTDKDKRDGIVRTLNARGVGVNLHYIPVYRHPYMQYKYSLPGAESYYNRSFTVPLFPNLSHNKIDYICNIINSSF